MAMYQSLLAERLRVVDGDRDRAIAIGVGIHLRQVIEHVTEPLAGVEVERGGVGSVVKHT